MRGVFARGVQVAIGVVTLNCSSDQTDSGAVEFTVIPATFSLARNDTLRLRTVARNDVGDSLTGIPVQFHSNDTSIVTVDAFGLVRAGIGVGSTTITAVLTRSILRTTVNATVFAVPGGFTLAPRDTFVFQGGSVQLAATARDTGGITIPGAAVTYTTTGPIVVNGTALVTSLGPAGEASVTGRFDPYVITSKLHVLDTALAGNRVSAVGHASAAAVSRSGIALVTRTLAVFLTRINLPSLASSQFRVPLGLSALAFDTTGAQAYALDPSGKVQIIDVATNVAADSFTTTGVPTAEVVTADNLQIFVASTVDSVFRYGRTSLARLGAFAVPASVTAMVRHPLSAALIYLALPDSGLVLEYDIAGDSIRRRLPLGAAPARLAVAIDGSELYASDRSAATVQVWDLTANAALTTIPVGVAAADIAVSPDGARIWVSARTQGQVKEIDKASRAIVRIITTSGAPRGVAISPLDGTAVVANDSGWVDVIKP